MRPKDQVTSTSTSYQQTNPPSPLLESPSTSFGIMPLETSAEQNSPTVDSALLEKFNQCKSVDELLAKAKDLNPGEAAIFFTYIKRLEAFYNHKDRSKYQLTQFATKRQLVVSLARLGGVTADKFNEMEELILKEISENKSAYVDYYYQALASLYQSYLALSKQAALTSGKQTAGKVGAVDMRRSFEKLITSMNHVKFLDDINFPASAFLDALQAQFDVMDKVGVEELPDEFLKAMKVVLKSAKLSKQHQTLSQQQIYQQLRVLYAQLQKIAESASEDAATRIDALYSAASHSVMLGFHLAGMTGTSNPAYFLLTVLDITNFFKALGSAVLPAAITSRLAKSKAWLKKQSGSLDEETLINWEEHRKQLTLDAKDAAFKKTLKHYQKNKVHVCVEINLVNHLFALLETKESDASTKVSLSEKKYAVIVALFTHYFQRFDVNKWKSKIPFVSKKVTVEPCLYARLITGFYQRLQAVGTASDEGKTIINLLKTSLLPTSTIDQNQTSFLLWTQPQWTEMPIALQCSLIVTLSACYQVLRKQEGSEITDRDKLFNAQINILKCFFEKNKDTAFKGFVAKQVDQCLGATGLTQWSDSRRGKFIDALNAVDSKTHSSSFVSHGKLPSISEVAASREIDPNETKDIQQCYLLAQSRHMLTELSHSNHNDKARYGLKPTDDSPLELTVRHKNKITSNFNHLNPYYVDLNVGNQPISEAGNNQKDNSLISSIDAFKNFLKRNQEKVLLLLGSAGAGKSSFCCMLEKLICAGSDETLRGYLPIRVELKEIYKVDALSTVKSAMKYLKYESLSNATYLTFSVSKLVLIFDGFNEIVKSSTLPVFNTTQLLKAYLNAKIVITSRPLGWTDAGKLRDHFQTRFQNTAEHNSVKVQYLAPLTSSKIYDIVKKITPDVNEDTLNHSKTNWTSDKVVDCLEQFPQLMGFAKNPLMLSLIVRILPDAVEVFKSAIAASDTTVNTLYSSTSTSNEISGKLSTHAQPAKMISRYKIYKLFLERWIERERSRIEDSFCQQAQQLNVEASANNFPSADDFQKFARNLAFDMFVEGSSIISIITEKDSHGTNRPRKRKQEPTTDNQSVSHELSETPGGRDQLLRQGCPLVCVEENKFIFNHESFLEFFAAEAILENLFLGHNLDHEHELDIFDNGFLKSDQPLRKLNYKYLIEKQGVLEFVCDRVIELGKPAYDLLLKIVLASRQRFNEGESDPIAIAASNAITILNFSGVQFLKPEGETTTDYSKLSGVRIPGADLSYGTFDQVDFSGADLSGVRFVQSYLHQVNFADAKMEGILLGEFPVIFLDQEISLLSQNPKNQAQIAIGLKDGQITLRNPYESSLESTAPTKHTVALTDHAKEVECAIDFSSDGTRVATGGPDSKIYISLTQDGRLEKELKTEHPSGIQCLRFCLNDKYIATSGDDKYIYIQSTNDNKGLNILTLTGHSEKVIALAVYRDPRGLKDTLYSISEDKTIKTWSLSRESSDYKNTTKIKTEVDSIARCLAVSDDGKWLASAGKSRSETGKSGFEYIVCLWSLSKPKPSEPKIYLGHTSAVHCLVFSPDSSVLVSGSRDTTVKIWSVETGKLLSTHNGHVRDVSGVAFYKGSGQELISASLDKTVRRWSLEKFETTKHRYRSQSGTISGLAVSNDKKIIASASYDRSAYVLSAETGEMIWRLEGHKGTVRSVVIFDNPVTNTNEYITGCTSENNQFSVWKMDSVQPVMRLANGLSMNHIYGLDISPDGELIAVAGLTENKSGQITLVDTRSLEKKKLIVEHTKAVICVKFHAIQNKNTYMLASGSMDSSAKIWKITTNENNINMECLHTLEEHKDAVWCVDWSPDGKKLATAGLDNEVIVWGDSEYKTLHTLRGHTDRVVAAKFNPEGKYLLTASADKSVLCWETKHFKIIYRLWGHISAVRQLIWLTDDSFVTGSDSGIVRRWKICYDNKTGYVKNISLLWANSPSPGLLLNDCNVNHKTKMSMEDKFLFREGQKAPVVWPVTRDSEIIRRPATKQSRP